MYNRTERAPHEGLRVLLCVPSCTGMPSPVRYPPPGKIGHNEKCVLALSATYRLMSVKRSTFGCAAMWERIVPFGIQWDISDGTWWSNCSVKSYENPRHSRMLGWDKLDQARYSRHSRCNIVGLFRGVWECEQTFRNFSVSILVPTQLNWTVAYFWWQQFDSQKILSICPQIFRMRRHICFGLRFFHRDRG